MGPTTVKEETKQTMDPETAARLNENYDHTKAVTDQPFKPFTGTRVAATDPASFSAQERLLDVSRNDPGSDLFGQAKGIFSDLGSYSPKTITPKTYTPSLLKDANLSEYFNPYDSQVIDNFISDNERSRQIQRVNDSQSATAAKAFGGARHGVADSLTNEAFGRTAANTIAGLRQGGYDRALSSAAGDVDRKNQGGMFDVTTDMQAQGQNASNDMQAAGFRAEIGNALKQMSDVELGRALQLIGLEDTVGMTRQAQEQALAEAAYEAYQAEYADTFTKLGARNAALGMYPALVNTSSTQTKSGGGLGAVLSPLLGAAGMALSGPLGPAAFGMSAAGSAAPGGWNQRL